MSGCFGRTAARVALWAILALAACATPRIAVDYDRGAQFTSFHRFVVIARPHPGLDDNPLVIQRTSEAIAAELMRKGFTHVTTPAQADFALDFSVGTRDRIDVSSYPSEIKVRQYVEGTLAIDVFDVRSHRPVWHGSATKELSMSEIEYSETPIREAVADVLADFPPK